MILTIVVFLLVLSLLVFVHEFGHFLAARRAGITVEEFGFGLPPRILGRKIGKTLYSLNLLPFGGFVRLLGEEATDPQAKREDSFSAQSLKIRAGVVLAGVLANALLAILLFYIILYLTNFKTTFPLILDHRFKFVDQTSQVLVLEAHEGSPARQAGIERGEIVLAVDGKKVENRDQFRQLLNEAGDRDVMVTIRKDSQQKEVKTRPTYDKELGRYVLGVSLGELAILDYQSPWQKIFAGFSHSLNIIEYSAKIFGFFIAEAFRSGQFGILGASVAGPVGIAQVTGEAVAAGLISVLNFIAILSLNLAVINILPIPALDGGRLFFLGIEAVSRRKVYPQFERWAHTIGLAILLALIFLITLNDIRRILGQ